MVLGMSGSFRRRCGCAGAGGRAEEEFRRAACPCRNGKKSEGLQCRGRIRPGCGGCIKEKEAGDKERAERDKTDGRNRH